MMPSPCRPRTYRTSFAATSAAGVAGYTGLLACHLPGEFDVRENLFLARFGRCLTISEKLRGRDVSDDIAIPALWRHAPRICVYSSSGPERTFTVGLIREISAEERKRPQAGSLRGLHRTVPPTSRNRLIKPATASVLAIFCTGIGPDGVAT